MGNSLGIRKTAKVMKISGETIKLKTPVYAGEVIKDYPGLVLLDSEEVKHYGIRAKPLEPQQELRPKRLYFLVELPNKVSDQGQRVTRRVRSGIHMSAKDRLESLMLARRSASDLTIINTTTSFRATTTAETSSGGSDNQNGMMRLKMRLPKAEVERLMKESKDEAEVAERIMNLCKSTNHGGCAVATTGSALKSAMVQPHEHWNSGGHGRIRAAAREKRVGFLPVPQAEIELAMAS